MGGDKARELIEALCQRLDERLDPKMLRRAALTLTIPVALAPACMMYGAPAYGVPFPEEEIECADGVDDDYDGLTDCADPDCATESEACLGCDDGIDNDGNGLADCADPDCAESEVCS
jgi:hypothetical protein